MPPGRCVKLAELQQERSPCNDNNSSPNPTAGNPIIVRTGAKIETVTDFETEDALFTLIRHYRSFTSSEVSALHQTPLGLAQGWQFAFAWELHIHDWFYINNELTLFSPDGSAYNFERAADGRIVPVDSDAEQIDIQLAFIGDWPENQEDVIKTVSQWQLIDSNNTTYLLNAFRPYGESDFTIARPVRITTQQGYRKDLSYGDSDELQTLSDSFGRTMKFSWIMEKSLEGNPRPVVIDRVELPDGNSMLYGYEGADAEEQAVHMASRLSSVSKMDTSGAIKHRVHYQYENVNFPYALTGITDARGIRSRSWAYDESGRAISSEGANGLNKTTIAYDDDDTPSRIVTNALGKETIYHYQRDGSFFDPVLRLASIEGKPSSNCVGSERRFHYNSDGFIDSTVDTEGNDTRYEYDGNTLGLPSRIIKTLGEENERSTEFTWDTERRLPTEIIEPALKTRFIYDEKERLREVHQTDLTTHTEPYSTNGNSRSWQYEYSDEGLLLSASGPGEKKTTYFYDDKGYLNRIKNELDQNTRIILVNGRGQPEIISGPNGIRTSLYYDTQGRLSRIKMRSGENFDRWRFSYDESSNLIAVTAPDRSYLVYFYDEADRIDKVRNNLRETITYRYDAMGNIIQRTIQDSSSAIVYQQNHIFDELGRLMSNIGADNHSWDYSYDRLNRLVNVSNPREDDFSLAYDGLNRIIQTIDEESAVTTLNYDKQDEITSHEDGREIKTEFVRNGWGEVIREISADRGITDYLRDEQGLIIQKTDARGIITDYSYDVSGRILTTEYLSEATNTISFNYDETENGNVGIGQLTRVLDNTGEARYHYDEQGRITKKTQQIESSAYSTAYQYDSGRLASILYPSGMEVTYTYDRTGRVSSVQAQKNGQAIPLIDHISWLPFGPIKQIQYASGIKETRAYDQNYRLQTLSVQDGNADLIHRDYAYQDGMNISAIDDPLHPANSEYYDYSPTGRIVHASGPWKTIDVRYDLSGNRLEWNEENRNQLYINAQDSNRLSSITGDKPVTYGYDDAGNLIFERKEDASTEYHYNAAGQLASISIDNIAAGSYRYNYLNQLAIHGNAAGVKHYLYNEEGQLIAETRTDGSITREYIWLNDKPVAINDHLKNEVYTIHTDHLERPLMLTNSRKTPIWTATWRPWGNPHSMTNNILQNMRFPGQMALEETHLFYNWNRYYDPTTGRYITSDPIGLEGGANTYAYVGENPVNYIDPLGLFGTQSCNYYQQACKANGGSYECNIASNVCPIFPDNNNPTGEDEAVGNWSECVRQCLQEKHKDRLPFPQSCSPDNNIDQGDNVSDHADCFSGCLVNPENPYNPFFGSNLPDDNPSLYQN